MCHTPCFGDLTSSQGPCYPASTSRSKNKTFIPELGEGLTMEIFDKAKAIISKLLAGGSAPGGEPPPVKESKPAEASKPAEVISETAHYKINKISSANRSSGTGTKSRTSTSSSDRPEARRKPHSQTL